MSFLILHFANFQV